MGFARSDFRSFRRAFVALCLVGLATPIVGSTAAAQGSGASISGTVLDGDGLPVADLTVLACPGSGVPSAGSFCDGNIFAGVDGGTGSYTLNGLAADTYNVYAGRGGVDFLSEPTQVTVDEDDLVAGIDFAFDSKIEGVVTDPNSDPVEGADVRLYRDFMNPLLSAYELGTTGATGDYASLYLPAGTYTVRVESASGSGLARAEVADVVVPPATASPPVTVDVQLEAGATVSGTVLDGAGSPVVTATGKNTGAYVCPAPLELIEGGCVGQFLTFADEITGEYAIEGITPGDYSSGAFGTVPTLPGDPQEDGVIVNTAASLVPISANDALTQNFVFDSRVAGVVTEGGAPVEGAEIALAPGGSYDGENPAGIAVTDAAGFYETPYLPATGFTLQMTPPPGSGLGTLQRSVTLTEGAVTTMNWPEATLTGTVLDADTGDPFDGITGVNICPGADQIPGGCPGFQSVQTDEAGVYSVTLGEGTYSVGPFTFLDNVVGVGPPTINVTVTDGQTTVQDFEIDVVPRIEGTVADRNGAPVPGRGVIACPGGPPGPSGCPGQINAGAFTLDGSARYALVGLEPDEDYNVVSFGRVGEAIVGAQGAVYSLGATEVLTRDWVFDSTIRGRVLAPDGVTPVGGVSVQFFVGGPVGGDGEVAVTEPDGTFETPFLPPATYSLRLVPPAGSGLPETTVPGVVVPANTDHDAGDLVLVATGTVVGTVLDADTGASFGNLSGVNVCPGTGGITPGCPGPQFAIANPAGAYSIDLVPGDWSVQGWTFLGPTETSVLANSAHVVVSVSEGATTEQDFEIDVLPRVEGTITDRDGVGVPGRGVIACPDGPPGPTGCAGQINAATFTLDGSPRYALTGLVPDDDYWVTGFGLVGDAVVGMPTEVFPGFGATEIATKDWVFDSKILGRVLAPDGVTPVEGVSVQFVAGQGPVGQGGEVAVTESTPGQEGTFETPFLSQGVFKLRLVPPAGSGLAETTIPNVVVPADTDHDVGDLVLAGESDGVPDAVEDGAPNGGDGNGDGIADSVQSHVTSLPNAIDGQYVTIESPTGTTLTNVEAIDPATLTPAPPAGAELPVGVVGFEVLVANPGDAADVVLHLPAGLSVDEYLKLHDGTWTLFPGASFDGDTATLSLVDGGAGDDDDTANGVIVEPGGPASVPDEQTATVEVSADTYLRSGNDNTNEGAATFLQVRSSGNNRALIAVDPTALDELIDGGEIISAELELDVVENGGNWGSEGRTVDIHRLTSAWAEGNGFVADHKPTDRGTGVGATWNCAIDAEIANQRPDCDGPTEWEMGKPNQPELHPWEPGPTDTLLITSDLSGEVAFDVTDDVLAFTSGSEVHHGWIIKKTVEGANGKVRFSSRQGTRAPSLVITYIPS